MALAIIVAVAKGRAIGRAGRLPWQVPEDLARFKTLTTGHAVIMGRVTHQSIGRALPNRRNVVVTRGAAAFPGCETAPSLAAALALVGDDALPFVIGGAALYAEALPLASHLYLTELDLEVPDADTFFPPWDDGRWREVRRARGVDPRVTFVDLERAT